jgi:signal transduction histidine kinase
MSTEASAPPAPDWPRLVCISTDVMASAALHASVTGIVPTARVDVADTSIVRSVPDADCVIVAVGAMYSAAESLVRELRARGYLGALMLVVAAPESMNVGALAPYGVAEVLAQHRLALDLPGALTRVLDLEGRATRSAAAGDMLRALRRVQSLVAAGEEASQLQHKLNNPLAALLAEAQLLELESLHPEHATSVRRIVELCRRVIEVTKSIAASGTVSGVEG